MPDNKQEKKMVIVTGKCGEFYFAGLKPHICSGKIGTHTDFAKCFSHSSLDALGVNRSQAVL